MLAVGEKFTELYNTWYPILHLRWEEREEEGEGIGGSLCLTGRNKWWACSHCAHWSVRDPFTATEVPISSLLGSERVSDGHRHKTQQRKTQFRSIQHQTSFTELPSVCKSVLQWRSCSLNQLLLGETRKEKHLRTQGDLGSWPLV